MSNLSIEVNIEDKKIQEYEMVECNHYHTTEHFINDIKVEICDDCLAIIRD